MSPMQNDDWFNRPWTALYSSSDSD